ncbi:MAG TPA: hypothetical protein DEQ02_06895 [Ruminococcaceae bacterium]|nr:hypothetical protein [Oscillospiraceae bacterium]
MRSIYMLATANIRKNKSQSVSLLIFVLIASALLCVGIVLLTGINAFFDSKGVERNAPHIYVLASQDADKDGISRYIKDYPGVTQTETLELVGGMGQFTAGSTTSTGYIFFSRADEKQLMDAPALIDMGDDNLILQGDAAYLPGFMLESDGGKIGEEFQASLYGAELNFTIAGATEEITFGSPMNTVYRIYVPDERFDEIAAAMPMGETTMISARLSDYSDAEQFQQDFSSDMPQDGVILQSSYLLAKQARTTFPTIVSILVVAFAVILLAVSLIIIHFRIVNSIQESMINIGTLKAVGYKSSQIVISMTMQFGLITLAGGILGLGVAQVFIPIVANILRPQLSLEWVPGFNPGAAAVSLGFMLLTVLLITYLSSIKIKKLHPLIALRGGITTHNFKKNVFPLEKARGSLSFLLALKQIFTAKRQAVMMGIIMMAVAVAVVMGLTLHYSMNVNTEGFIRGFFGEVPEVSLVLKDSTYGKDFPERIAQHPDVRKVFGFETGTVSLNIDGTDNNPSIVEDCALMEGNMLIEGQYPVHSNEIALGSSTARVLDKGAGDFVMVEANGNGTEEQYLVTGVVQYTNNVGFNGLITGDAIRRLLPDYEFYGYNIYLNEDVDIDSFIEDVKAREGDIFMSTSNTLSMIDVILSSMSGIVVMVAIGIVAITLVVVVLALYMVIKTIVIRRRRELGTQKALGYTTLQLMNQIALNLTPSILIGIAAGIVIGCVGFNPLVAAMMTGMGIVKADLPLPMAWLGTAGIALILLSYAVSMLIAVRIRKISAYALVSE